MAFVELPFPALGDDGQPAPGEGMVLGRETVFVVTGAAGSIVSAITADLAAASGGTFHLLDLTPAPDPDDPDLAAFRSDRDGLKATLAARMKAAGERPTPVAIERELARIERLNAALSAVQAVEAAGGTAHYHALDLRDAAAVDAAIADVRQRNGRIDVLLHAAGLEISRNLPDKEPGEFDLVFDVKSDGWFNLLRAARDLPIGATVVVLVRRRPLRQPGPDRLRRGQRPAVQDHEPPAAHAPADARAGARLDRLGRHRHGDARFDPEDHGDGRRADAAARGRRGMDPPRAAVQRLPRRGHRGRRARHDGGRAARRAVASTCLPPSPVANPGRCSARPA